MDAILVSVPHSGTTFYQNVINPNLGVTHLLHPDVTRVLKHRVSGAIACAIRRPEDVWASWWHRNKLFFGTEGDGEVQLIRWTEAWEALAALGKDRIFFLPIDHHSRSYRLALLGQYMSEKFEPDWDKIVNPRTQTRAGGPPKYDFGWIYQIPIVGDLYG